MTLSSSSLVARRRAASAFFEYALAINFRKNDPSEIIDCVNRALRHYNANNPGAEFDPFKALMFCCVVFRRALWVHVSFLARRRSSTTRPDEPVTDVKGGRKRNKAPVCPDKHFFAELRYDKFDSATVVTCRIIDKTTPHSFKTKCEFCPASFEILHPVDGKFACGKRDQRKELYMLRNFRLRRPYTWPEKEAGGTRTRTRQEQTGLHPVRQYALHIFYRICPRVLLSLVSKLWPGAVEL